MLENFLNLYQNFIGSAELIQSAANFTFKDIAQVLIVIFILIYVYMKFIRNTQAEKLVRGILFFIVSAWIFSAVLIALEFQILGQIAQYILSGLLLSMVIVFQPELRKLLVHLGQTKFVASNFFNFKNNNNEEKTNVIKEITEAVKYCSRVKRGALIVVQKTDDKSFYNEVGTTINADISAELILTIFFPNTPLHDGAMIINGTKIVAAGCFLPLSQNIDKIPKELGTRHRAGIGVTETIDVMSFIVSEETGIISVARAGQITRYADTEILKRTLGRYYWQELESARR
jgi:diadenylate cyclase